MVQPDGAECPSGKQYGCLTYEKESKFTPWPEVLRLHWQILIHVYRYMLASLGEVPSLTNFYALAIAD